MAYHISSNPPKSEGICDNCGEELYIRDDDKEETVLERLKTYHEKTAPLIDYYLQKGLLLRFDGTRGIMETTNEILDRLIKK